ncbi:MAG: hypothetical protein HWN79_18100 [Candidatus Lokiarchaeota archaeon]|nr:hypothetical protein [Candidatus Lokiarchaeota archaeon]
MAETVKNIQGYIGDVISKSRTLTNIPLYKDIKFMFSASALLTNKKKKKFKKKKNLVFRKNGAYPDQLC